MAENENTETLNKPTETTETSKEAAVSRGRRKVRVGKVTSTKMNKTITVQIERRLKHPIYKKYFKKTKKFAVHDENNTASEGDMVKIIETRPLSSRKRWRLVEIIEKVK